jgi:hypothetical protein
VKEPTIKIMGIIGQASGLLGFQVCWTRGSPKFDQGLSLTCSMVSMVSSLIHPKVSWFSRTCRFSSPVGWCYRKPIVFPGFFPLSGDSIDISHPKSMDPSAVRPRVSLRGNTLRTTARRRHEWSWSPHLVVIFEMIALSCSIHYQRFWTISIIEFHRISTEFNYDHPAACPLDTV